MVRDTLGELATIAGFGSRPQGGNHSRDAGSASARQDRHGGSAGKAEGQAEAICWFSAEEDRLKERVPRREAASCRFFMPRAKNARGKVPGRCPRPRQGRPPEPPARFPFCPMFQNGPPRQGYAAENLF